MTNITADSLTDAPYCKNCTDPEPLIDATSVCHSCAVVQVLANIIKAETSCSPEVALKSARAIKHFLVCLHSARQRDVELAKMNVESKRLH